jgi:hypothetical protein
MHRSCQLKFITAHCRLTYHHRVTARVDDSLTMQTQSNLKSGKNARRAGNNWVSGRLDQGSNRGHLENSLAPDRHLSTPCFILSQLVTNLSTDKLYYFNTIVSSVFLARNCFRTGWGVQLPPSAKFTGKFTMIKHLCQNRLPRIRHPASAEGPGCRVYK